MVFAFPFGLSMDYEVFILARMREEYDRTGSTETAVVRGIGRTGRLVTSAALILFLAFTSMASGPETDVKMMATGLAAGILLDATVIRALIVPAVITLMGRWNWWLPSWPARLLRVEGRSGRCGGDPHSERPRPSGLTHSRMFCDLSAANGGLGSKDPRSASPESGVGGEGSGGARAQALDLRRQLHEELHEAGIEVPPALGAYLPEGGLEAPRRLVGAL